MDTADTTIDTLSTTGVDITGVDTTGVEIMENEDFNINRNMHEDFDYDNTDVNGESENNITYDMDGDDISVENKSPQDTHITIKYTMLQDS